MDELIEAMQIAMKDIKEETITTVEVDVNLLNDEIFIDEAF